MPRSVANALRGALLLAGLAVLLPGCGGAAPSHQAAGSPGAARAAAPGGAAAPAADERATDERAAGDTSSGETAEGVLHLQVRRGEAEGLAYLEVVVGDVPVDAPLPLVLGLHGLGDRPRIPGDPALGQDLPYRIVMPRAPEPWKGGGYTWLPVRVRDGEIEILSRALKEQADRLARFVETIRRERPTVGRPVVTGGSQGGMLAFALAVQHPARLAGAVPVMGWLPPRLVPGEVDDPEAYPPLYAVHGTADRVIPIGLAHRSVASLRELGLDVRLESFEGVGHRMTDPMGDQVKAWLARMLEATRNASRSD